MPLSEVHFTMDGFRGCRQVRTETPDLSYLWTTQNLVFPSPGEPCEPYPRYGFTRASATQMGSGSTRVTNLMYEFVTNTGTRHRIVCITGKFYTISGATGAPTETLTAAHFAAAAITLDATSWWSATTINNQVVISDGTNTPWMWDGTAGAGLTLLTNAPVFYGKIVTYYGKVAGIKNTDRTTFVWSEENDPETGYEAGGYNNSWTLAQTSGKNLISLCATNDALYYWRDSGIGRIRGAVTPDFSATGVRDAVSENIGTLSPWATAEIGHRIWFLDQYGRPQTITNGVLDDDTAPWKHLASGYVNVASLANKRDDICLAGLLQGVGGPLVSDLAEVLIVAIPRYNLVAFMWQPTNRSYRLLILFDAATGIYTGYWTVSGGTLRHIGSFWAEQSSSFTGYALHYTDGDGYLYGQALTSRSLGKDHNSSGTETNFSVAAVTNVIGAPNAQCYYEQVAVGYRTWEDGTLNLNWSTSYLDSLLGAGKPSGQTTTITRTSTTAVAMDRVVFGIDSRARKLAVDVGASSASFSLAKLVVSGFVTPLDPETV